MPPEAATIVDTPPPSPAPAPKSEIHVVPPIAQPAEPAAPPKPGSAKSRLFESLRQKGKPADQVNTPPVTPSVPTVVPAPTPASGEPPAASQDSPEAPSPTNGEAPIDKKKVNPWKLVDEYKKKLADTEKNLLETKNSVVPDQERKTITERLTKAETRAKELEDHIRFVDYSKSEEFKTKYQDPYDKAWLRATSELKEINVTDPGSETPRAATPQDLLQLVNLPLGQARELANALFGDFADDVMAHRKEIRNLFEAQSTALEDAKKNGAERTKKQQEDWNNAQKDITNFVADTWKKANEA